MTDKPGKPTKAITPPATDTADIATLIQKVDALSIRIEVALKAMEDSSEQAEDAGMAIRTVLTEGIHIPHLLETATHLGQIERKLLEANLGPNAAHMEEMMRPPIALMKRMGKERIDIALRSDWRAQRISVATGLTITLIQSMAVIVAKATGWL